MGTAVRKTISLPPDLAKETEDIARTEGKTLSAVVQDALRIARIERLKNEFNQIQDYWSKKAKEKISKISKITMSKPEMKKKLTYARKLSGYKHKIQVIVHLAGQAGVRYSIKNPITYLENNIVAYVNLLEIPRARAVLVILGILADDRPVPYNSNDLYDRSLKIIESAA